jgi:nucleolin
MNVRLLKDKDTRKSRGIAVISFTNQAALDKALEYHGTDYGGRSLLVQVAERGGGKSSKEAKGKGKGKGKGEGPGEKPDGCTSVVVKGLAFSVTDDDLKKAFKSCGGGPTHVKICLDKDTGSSRGIAFVDFDDEAAIDDAMKLNGSELKGRRFTMDYATPREMLKAPGEKPEGCISVVVKGLAYAVAEKHLAKTFESCGSGPSNIRIAQDNSTGLSRGIAFIDFDSTADVDEAIKLHGTDLMGRRFIMDYAAPLGESGEKKAAAGKKSKGPGKKPEGCTSVTLKGLAESVSEKTLTKLFKACGTGPRSINLVNDKESGVFFWQRLC